MEAFFLDGPYAAALISARTTYFAAFRRLFAPAAARKAAVDDRLPVMSK
jgi:hypothetical protein